MKITKEIEEELKSILSLDQSFLELHLDDCLIYGINSIFDRFKKKFNLTDADIKKIIYNLIWNNKVAFFIFFGTSILYDQHFDRFFRLKCNFNHKLIKEIDLQNIQLKELTTEIVIEKIGELLEQKSLILLDGNWNKISDEEYEKVQQMFKISVKKHYPSLLNLAKHYKNQKHIYNSLIVEYIEKTKDADKVNLLFCENDLKEKIKNNLQNIRNIFYKEYYNFFNEDLLPSFTDNNPFYQLYESLFEAIKDSIKSRKIDIINYGRKLKIASEQFENAIRNSSWAVDQKVNLSSKFDKVVNFGRWLYNLGRHFENEYYLTSELKEELFNYLDFIERKLYYPVIILLTSNLYQEKYSIFEEYLRYYDLKDFDFRKITDKIDEDYEREKTIKEICERRNSSILWEEEGGPKGGTTEKQFEDQLYLELQHKYPNVERNKRLLNHTGTDFLASDGKNTLILIEAKTGNNAARPNNIKKMLPIIKELEIKKAYYIINEDVTNQDSINTAKEFCELLNIEFIQKKSEQN